MTMLSFQVEGFKFNYRVAGIILHEGRVLLHHVRYKPHRPYENFWVLPGGRVEMMETAATALTREIQEEMGVTAQVERLVFVTENFFALEGLTFHEIALYYLASLPPEYIAAGTLPVLDEPDYTLVFEWIPLTRVADTLLYPVFLRERLLSLPASVEHLVVNELPTSSVRQP